MDEIDLKILRCLQKRPSIPMTELADQVGLSHTPCWRRIKRLEEDGIILGRELVIDGNQIGISISVIAEVKIKNHDENVLLEFENEIQEHPEIVECFSMSGESDYILRVLVRSVADYEKFLKRVLLHLPGVGAVNSRFALKSIKLTLSLPL